MAREESASNSDRPQYQSGVGTINGTTFHWGSGTPGRYWSIPYGDYPVTPDAPTGAWAHQVGAIPIANNIIPDPVLNRNRVGIMIHPSSSDHLDQLYTQGCFAVAPQEWPAVKQQILEEASKGPLYLHVQPGQAAAFTHEKTLSQAGAPPADQSPPGTTINASNAPVAGALAKPNYTFTLPQNAPMGMGNNNPLNIKYYKGAENDYAGVTGPSKNTDQGDPQMVFSSPEAGWAAAYQLLSKKYGAGKITPNMIIAGQGGWTPGNTQAAANVAKAAGIGPDEDIKFTDPAKAQAFMRALVTQEQGAAGKAYPDEMIASAIGGAAAPSTSVATNTGTASAPTAAPAAASNAPAAAPAAPITDDRPWYNKAIGAIFQSKQEGQKSPFEKAAEALTGGGQSAKEMMAAQAPERSALSSMGPGARNVSPGLQSVGQTYGQTLNSFLQPLTWTSRPLGATGMPQAGLLPSTASVPGISLNTPPVPSQGLGYGINPVGYGFG